MGDIRCCNCGAMITVEGTIDQARAIWNKGRLAPSAAEFNGVYQNWVHILSIIAQTGGRVLGEGYMERNGGAEDAPEMILTALEGMAVNLKAETDQLKEVNKSLSHHLWRATITTGYDPSREDNRYVPASPSTPPAPAPQAGGDER